MNRRDWMTVAGSTIAAFTFSAANLFAQENQRRENRREGRQQRLGGRTLKKYPNEHYYKNGKLDEKVAKEAFAELFRFHRYSLAESVLNSSDFWVVDFGLNDFSNVGMGGIFFVNDKEHNYFGHEIYLLPGQMIAEHKHVPAENKAAKHELWQVRNGQIWTFAEGGNEADIPADVKIPESQKGKLTSCKVKKLEVGGIDVLTKLEAPHFMLAGPEGAIVTEYASFHSPDGLKFINPAAKL